MRPQLLFILSAILLGILLSSCQNARELHYFKSGDNYYRLRITESSFASKARYLSGYFDQKALDKYFSEMSQPDSGRFADWVGQSQGSELVMILSTNSTAVAEQIGQLASNEELLENIALLANKSTINEAKAIPVKMENFTKVNKAMISAGNVYIEPSDTSNIKVNISDFLNALKRLSKDKMILSNIDEAIYKYKQN